MRMFFCICDDGHRDLHSFPTRRSSDLVGTIATRISSLRSPSILEVVFEPGGPQHVGPQPAAVQREQDRKSTRLNSSHPSISYAVFCLKKKNDLPRPTGLGLRPCRLGVQ